MGGQGDRASLENRWWVDQQKTEDGVVIRPEAKFGHRFFRTGDGYDQNTAQRRLTDLNLKWFDEAPGEPGEMTLLHTLPKQRVPEPRVAKIRRALSVPPDGRGVLVDSGEAIRAIITGNPVGERLVEVRLGKDSCFDAWVHGEWVREVSFRNFEDALRKVPRLVDEYLNTDRAASLG